MCAVRQPDLLLSLALPSTYGTNWRCCGRAIDARLSCIGFRVGVIVPVFTRLEELVTGPEGLRWLKLLQRLSLGGLPKPSENAMAEELVALGLCKPDSTLASLAELGRKCADSAREYVFWVERNRKLPYEGGEVVATLETYRGKDVLE
jgi:hypothetical protein